MQHTLVPTYTRVYPGDADDVVTGHGPRPAQGESTVEVGRVYLITDKGLDLAPRAMLSRTAGRSDGIQGIRRRFTDMDLDSLGGMEIWGWYSSVYATPSRA